MCCLAGSIPQIPVDMQNIFSYWRHDNAGRYGQDPCPRRAWDRHHGSGSAHRWREVDLQAWERSLLEHRTAHISAGGTNCFPSVDQSRVCPSLFGSCRFVADQRVFLRVKSSAFAIVEQKPVCLYSDFFPDVCQGIVRCPADSRAFSSVKRRLYLTTPLTRADILSQTVVEKLYVRLILECARTL